MGNVNKKKSCYNISIVAVVKYLHNLIKCFELSMDSSCVNLNVDGVL